MTSDQKDKYLIKQYIKGNKKALEKIYLKYKNSLFNLIWYYVNNAEDAKDIFQTVFEKLIKNIKKYKPKKNISFKTYLFKIAINCSKDFLRKKRIIKFISFDTLKKVNISDKNYDKIEDSDVMEFIKNEVNKLPSKYRDVIILVYYKKLKYSEVSQILGIPIGTVKFRINYGISLLKDKLRRWSDEK